MKNIVPGDALVTPCSEPGATHQPPANVTKEHKIGTYDLGLKNTSLEVAEEVARKL